MTSVLSLPVDYGDPTQAELRQDRILFAALCSILDCQALSVADQAEPKHGSVAFKKVDDVYDQPRQTRSHKQDLRRKLHRMELALNQAMVSYVTDNETMYRDFLKLGGVMAEMAFVQNLLDRLPPEYRPLLAAVFVRDDFSLEEAKVLLLQAEDQLRGPRGLAVTPKAPSPASAPQLAGGGVRNPHSTSPVSSLPAPRTPRGELLDKVSREAPCPTPGACDPRSRGISSGFLFLT
eukprot:jgi/Mesvir1/15075/Mv14719-RA.1